MTSEGSRLRASTADGVMGLDEAAQLLQSPAYEAASAVRKQQMLWAAVEGTRYTRLPPITFSFIMTSLRTLSLPLMAKPFQISADVRPPRDRLFHKFGTVAKVRFVAATDHPFTGLYRTGAVGVLRLSIGLNKMFYFPGVALKLLVDGQPSQNVVCVHSMDPQNNKDFFAQDKSNILAAPTRLPFGVGWQITAWWMSLVANPLQLSVAHLAAVNSDGSRCALPRTPQQIHLRSAEWHFDPATTDDYRAELGRIPPSTVLYRLFGSESIGGPDVYIGDIQMESQFVASSFGDRVLSFHHVGWGK